MKNILLTLAIVFLGTLNITAQKFAYVNTDYILKKIPEFQQAQDKLDAFSSDWQNEIESRYSDVEKMYRSYQQEQVLGKVKDIYQTALDKGIAKEQARAILPEGLTESTLYMNGTLRSWMHYIDLRTANGTQREHMEIAGECAKAIEPIFPMIKEFNQLEGTN